MGRSTGSSTGQVSASGRHKDAKTPCWQVGNGKRELAQRIQRGLCERFCSGSLPRHPWLSRCFQLGGSWEPLPWREAWCCQQGGWQCLPPLRSASSGSAESVPACPPSPLSDQRTAWHATLKRELTLCSADNTKKTLRSLKLISNQ